MGFLKAQRSVLIMLNIKDKWFTICNVLRTRRGSNDRGWKVFVALETASHPGGIRDETSRSLAPDFLHQITSSRVSKNIDNGAGW